MSPRRKTERDVPEMDDISSVCVVGGGGGGLPGCGLLNCSSSVYI